MPLMTSNKPYFIRAIYDWILDNNCTPYIVVDATLPFVDVPQQFIDDGKIILNVLPTAVQGLTLGDEWITFSARFSGISEDITIPIGAVIAIYAQENTQGMGFEIEALPEDYFEEKPIKKKSKTSVPPTLSVIQDDEKNEDEIKSKKDKKPNLTIIK